MSDVPQKLPPKKEVALALLEGPSMFVHLDPRKPGVLVPRRFLDKPQLVLQVGMNMVIPIPDLTVDEEGVSCTLSFDRAPFWCRMPWVAIYALVGEDGRGMMWPSDIPPEVVAQMQSPPPKEAGKPQAKRPRTKLAAVSQAPRESEPEQAEQAETTETTETTEPVEERPKPQRVPAQLTVERVPVPEGAFAEDEPQVGASQERPRSQPVQPTQAGSRKPKRELPPYLRVIK